MGQFRVTVVAVGNHGCGRDGVRSGEGMMPCGQANCTDCITRRYVADLKASGAALSEATVHHWPGTKGEVIDNLLTGIRTGSFVGPAAA